MIEKFDDILEKGFHVPENEGTSKVCELSEAVRQYVKPGAVLHFAFSHVRCPSAFVHEITRQFWEKKPGFTLITLAVNAPMPILFRGGLVKKVIAGAVADPYHSPRPLRMYQEAFREKVVELENWSLLTLVLRLKAGAMGVPFVTTKSLIGSDMAAEEQNLGNFQVIDDPFGSGQKVGLVKALNPDLTLAHGWVADKYGNTVFLPPWGDNFYGALGSKNGVLVSVEKIVSTDFIRRYSHLVKIPGYMVRSVSEVPFGAHPSGLFNQGMSEFHGYIEDFDFFQDFHDICQDTTKLDSWIKEWVLDCHSYSDYLSKVGHKRLLTLRGRSYRDSWRSDIEALTDSLNTTLKYTDTEMAAVAGFRKLKEIVKNKGFQTILAGAGLSFLAPCMATNALQNEGYAVEMMVELGQFGQLSRPGSPYLASHAHLPTCIMLTDSETMLGIFAGGKANKCIGSIASAEVDKNGNINSTKIAATNTFISGSGGANDISSSSQEIMVTAVQGRNRFLNKVSYITSPGKNVKTLISNLGVFEKLGDSDEFTLTGYFRNPSSIPPEAAITHIKQNCTWDLKVSPAIVEIPPPSLEELLTVRLLDPRRIYLGEL